MLKERVEILDLLILHSIPVNFTLLVGKIPQWNSKPYNSTSVDRSRALCEILRVIQSNNVQIIADLSPKVHGLDKSVIYEAFLKHIVAVVRINYNFFFHNTC